MWFIATVCGLLAVFGPYQLSSMNYVYNNTHLAIFNAAAPILWSIFVLWAILATDNGHGGNFYICVKTNGMRNSPADI